MYSEPRLFIRSSSDYLQAILSERNPFERKIKFIARWKQKTRKAEGTVCVIPRFRSENNERERSKIEKPESDLTPRQKKKEARKRIEWLPKPPLTARPNDGQIRNRKHNFFKAFCPGGKVTARGIPPLIGH
ncbi:hypothetical protein TNCV_3358561 [Trichonephila clavipes]|nr:hypothetical protein TNCV_3358561 [Trichonephila clavipes]